MRIHAIQTGTVAVKASQADGGGRRRRSFARLFADRRWTEPLPILAWLIEHPEGLIVVDTGETARTAEPGYLTPWQPYFRLGLREWVRPDEEIGPQLRRLGFAPDDVRWVVITHFHTDHVGGLAHFPHNEIVTSPGRVPGGARARGPGARVPAPALARRLRPDPGRVRVGDVRALPGQHAPHPGRRRPPPPHAGPHRRPPVGRRRGRRRAHLPRRRRLLHRGPHARRTIRRRRAQAIAGDRDAHPNPAPGRRTPDRLPPDPRPPGRRPASLLARPQHRQPAR